MYYRPARFNLLPDVIKNLMIINGLFFMATVVFDNVFDMDLGAILGLYLPGSPEFRPFQLITHMFMHGNFAHIFFNMFALWMFGNMLENTWGARRFLTYYLVTGLGAALLHLGVNYYSAANLKSELVSMGYTTEVIESAMATGDVAMDITPAARVRFQELYQLYHIPTVGASGAVFGVLLAFGMMFPNTLIYIYFLFPIKAKYFVILYGLAELYSGFSQPGSNIAHFAHLGGMLFGFILIKLWQRRGIGNYDQF
jgi:membrane associated rhomboid family serine protease